MIRQSSQSQQNYGAQPRSSHYDSLRSPAMPGIFNRNYQSRLYQHQQRQLQLQSQGSSASEPNPQQTKVSATTTLGSKKNSASSLKLPSSEKLSRPLFDPTAPPLIDHCHPGGKTSPVNGKASSPKFGQNLTSPQAKQHRYQSVQKTWSVPSGASVGESANFDDPLNAAERQRAEIERLRAYAKKKKKRDAEQKRIDFRGFDAADLISSSDEDEIFHGRCQILNRVVDDEEILTEEILLDKYENDRKRVRDALIAKTGGKRDTIKDLRFLMASVQTYGNLDGTCMLAEYAMNEFSFKDGVIDRFSTVVGPWTIENDIQRSRAMFHANETHRIPLHNERIEMDKRQLVMEILGRTEPSIAREQGVRVGLYTDEAEVDDEKLCKLAHGQQNPYHLLDATNRRWIIVLKQEYTNMMLACETLGKTIGLQYEGQFQRKTTKIQFSFMLRFAKVMTPCCSHAIFRKRAGNYSELE
ncbi:hypothetical protein WR25_21704 isoform A [Diploscapter pachys]|uniref:Maelstrom domain-containing protein n=1 Tax=Diploscapter pachys TaxID=2018661 RepID=A0A2A2LCD4_9BILA|nr:hypothetical protein WR25_21704 isoform A [Diploscapter pachys]